VGESATHDAALRTGPPAWPWVPRNVPLFRGGGDESGDPKARISENSENSSR
jgi:hypothetical protein